MHHQNSYIANILICMTCSSFSFPSENSSSSSTTTTNARCTAWLALFLKGKTVDINIIKKRKQVKKVAEQSKSINFIIAVVSLVSFPHDNDNHHHQKQQAASASATTKVYFMVIWSACYHELLSIEKPSFYKHYISPLVSVLLVFLLLKLWGSRYNKARKLGFMCRVKE